MVAAVSTTLNSKTTAREGPPRNPTRPPLLPSEPDNAIASRRRPKSREVTSRYMSASSSSSSTSSSSSSSSSSASNSRRCPSPLVSRTPKMTPMPSAPSLERRAQSVERRRTATPRPNSLDLRASSGNGEVSAAQRLLFTSARSLSVSFQGESFSLQVSKAKPLPSARKGTPERRKATTPTRAAEQTENSRLAKDQRRWPGRLRKGNCMTQSLDCTDDRKKVGGSASRVVRALQNSMADVSARICPEQEKAVELAASDTESVSSGSTSGTQDCGNGSGGAQGPRGGPRGIEVPARFWQETNYRLQRQQEPCSPSERKTVGIKTMASTTKLLAPKKLSIDSPVSSPRGVVNSRGQFSPVRGAARPASPNRLSPSRGMSPSRVRSAGAGAANGNMSNTPSILSFAADIRKGRIADSRMVDAHSLRILHNRVLQWRFVNARADAALSAQTLNAERSLYTARITTSKLRESVRAKRTELQLLKQNLKLTSILKGQMTYLEEWALMDQDYCSSLSGATEALKASTLRLPVVGGAKADVQNVKDAICSALDVMQAMGSSVCLLLSKVGDANSLVAELSHVSAKERALLDQCNDLLSIIAAFQVKECSLRTHIVQQKRVSSNLTMEV